MINLTFIKNTKMSLFKRTLIFILLGQSLNMLPSVIYAEDIFSLEETVDTGEGEAITPELNNSEHQDISGTSKTTDQDNLKAFDSAKVIAVNKITAQSREIILKMGEPKYFGNIEIKAHKCYKDLNPYNPDSKILLTVVEEKVDEEPAVLFQGWMMSSNISISTFEHPVYEIFAKSCL